VTLCIWISGSPSFEGNLFLHFGDQAGQIIKLWEHELAHNSFSTQTILGPFGGLAQTIRGPFEGLAPTQVQ